MNEFLEKSFLAKIFTVAFAFYWYILWFTVLYGFLALTGPSGPLELKFYNYFKVVGWYLLLGTIYMIYDHFSPEEKVIDVNITKEKAREVRNVFFSLCYMFYRIACVLTILFICIMIIKRDSALAAEFGDFLGMVSWILVLGGGRSFFRWLKEKLNLAAAIGIIFLIIAFVWFFVFVVLFHVL